MEPKLGKDAIVQNMFEINYSHLIQYEILEKLVTYMDQRPSQGPYRMVSSPPEIINKIELAQIGILTSAE